MERTIQYGLSITAATLLPSIAKAGRSTMRRLDLPNMNQIKLFEQQEELRRMSQQ